jgi:hypothetical protein
MEHVRKAEDFSGDLHDKAWQYPPQQRPEEVLS